MKILFFLDNFPGFSETFIYNQIYYLIDQGYQVDVISLKRSSITNIHANLENYGISKNVKTLSKFGVLNLLKNIIISPLLSFSIIRRDFSKKSLYIISNFHVLKILSNYQIIHAHYGHVGAFISKLKRLGVFNPRLKLIVSFHGNDIMPGKIDFYKIKYSNFPDDFDVIIANSPYMKKLLISCFPNSEVKINILPASISHDFLNHSVNKVPSKAVTFLFCGRFIFLKNPLFVLEIFRKILNMGYNVKLNMVGEGELLKTCKDFVIDHSLDDFVNFHGYLPHEEIISVYLSSDIFLFPGTKGKFDYAETQGLVLQEAQVMRLPVLVSDVGGMRYGIVDGETGFVLPENDLDSFVEKAMFLIENPEVRHTMGNKGFEFVLKSYSSNILGDRLLNDIYLNSWFL